MLVGLSVKTSDSLSLSISIFSPRTHPWPLGLVPVIVCISLPSIIARIMISNRSFITCLLFCHYWESMKRLQRISAISAKYSGSHEIRSSEVLLYFLCKSLIPLLPKEKSDLSGPLISPHGLLRYRNNSRYSSLPLLYFSRVLSKF